VTRGRKILAWSGGTVGMLLLALFALIAWLLFTVSGARWVAGLVTQRFAPQVKYAAIDGTIAGELSIRDFRFEGDEYTAKIRVARMTVDPTLSMLFSRVLRIDRATVSGLVLTLPDKEKPDEPDEPLWVEPPLAVEVHDFVLEDGRIIKAGEQLLSLRQLQIAARWTRESLTIERLTLAPGDIEGNLAASGRITPAGDSVRGVFTARWSQVVIPERLAGMTLATQGTLAVDGTPQRYAAHGNLDLGPPGDPSHITLAVNGTDRALQIEKLDLVQRAGRLGLAGELGFDPVMAWNLTARADDFNPGAFLAEWPGRIDLDFASKGELADSGPRGTLKIAKLSGTLRGRPLAGHGDLEFAAPSKLAGDLSLSSGRSRLAVRGGSGARQQIDATVELAVASLNDWVPHTAGSLTGRFAVRGVWPKLSIEGAADGKNLGLLPPEGEQSGGSRVRTLHVAANVRSPLDPDGGIEITARSIDVAGLQFSTARISGAGNMGRHHATLDVTGDRLNVSLTAAGGVTKTGWSGELSRLKLEAPDIAGLALRRPARIVYDAGAFSISQSCLADEASSLCVAANLAANGALDASYSFEHVPLGLANALAPEVMPGQLRGELQGTGKIRRAADGQWFGEARIVSPSARMVMQDDGLQETALRQHTWLLYENLVLEAHLQGNEATARFEAALDHGGRLAGNAALSQLAAATPGLRGDVTATVPSLAPLASFVPTVGNLDGAVDARIRIGGTVQAPEFTGNVNATRLQADLGQLGIELREGEVHAEAARVGGFRLEGHVKSGKGQLQFRGSMSERGVVDAHIDGENFLAADIPAANVVISPDLAFTGDPKAWLLEGDVAVGSAAVNLQKLPTDQPPGVSPDVVVVRDGKVVESAAQEGSLPLTARINVKLGERISITGYGLDATVTGQLQVRESPGAPTTGSGQLSVSGRYQAYGQDLTIKEGRLLFAGTPLDNPRLSIVAMREINGNLSTGLKIAGSAQRPIVTVVSDPEVGEADALSYLVTGRSLNDVGSATGSSQDTLASATQSLEGAAGGLIAKRIGKRLGLDEAGVEENEMIGGSALTVGEYLSPRLYLSYGVGLFQPGEVIALRYKLSSDVGVKVQRGSEETRAGVEYRIEK